MLPTEFRTQLLDAIAPELRERAMFSAGVIEAEKLQDMDDLIGQMLEGKLNLAEARTELKRRFGSLGAEVDETDLTDLRSDARLNLILDTNVEQAQGYGSWAQGQDEAILDLYPAQELYRAIEAREPRDWSSRWRAAGGREFGGRMIALKDDPIWSAISRFGLPYPPFDFGSGMDVRDIDREEAMALGLIDRDTRIEPQTRGFADDLAASPEVRSDALRQALQAQFEGIADFDESGVFRLLGGQTKNAANSYDPSQSRADDGRWTDSGGAPIGSRPRDFLGKRPAEGESHLPDDDNIARGKRAIEHLLNRQRGSIPQAMHVRELGKVEFAWGNTGRKAADATGRTYTGGGGLAHIAAKHPESVKHIPEWIVKGEKHAPRFDSQENRWKRDITHQGNRVVLSSRSADSKNHWLITGFDPARQ